MNYLEQIIKTFSSYFKWWIIVLPWEAGIRVWLGKKTTLLKPGIHIRIPLLHAIYIQTIRMRVVTLPPQTIATRSGKLMTISAVYGYSISDIVKVYETLHHPEMTISNMVLSEIATYLMNNSEVEAEEIQEEVLKKLCELEYGLTFSYVRIISFCQVKALRLIMDQNWMPDGLDVELKK